MSFRFFRLNFTRILDGGNIVPTAQATGNLRVSEFEIMYGPTPYPTSDMTAANAPAPLVASASGDNGSGFEAWRAFDGGLNDGSRWISNGVAPPYWIQIDLGSGIVPTGYRFAPDNAAAGGYFALDWTLQGSNTGAFAGEQFVLDTQTNVTTGWTGATLRSFPVTLPPSAATSITLVDLNKKVYARDAGRKPWRTKVLSGTYTGGAPEFVGYQLHLASDSSVAQAWTPLAALTIGGGNWTGTARIPQGGEYNLSVRADSDPGVVANGTFDFSVGLMILALGQSNCQGLFLDGSADTPNPQTYWYYPEGSAWIAAPALKNFIQLLNEINDLVGVPVGIMHAAATAAPQDYALSVANGGTLSAADGSTGYTWDNWITARINSMGEPFEFVIWHQGESGSDYYIHPTYADKLNLIHEQVCAISGRTKGELPFIVASINSSLLYTDGSHTTPVLHTSEENIAQNLTQTAILNARHKFPYIVLSHSSYGAEMVEEDYAGNKIFLHYTHAEHQLNASRYGRTIAAILGGAQGGPLFEITHARTVNATTTDLFVRSPVATDFTGKTGPTGLTGFEASGDNGTTWALAAAARLNATTIRVTHGSLSTSSTRRVRYGYGWDAPITNPVVDTSAYASYLMPTPTRYGIAPQPLAVTAAPVFSESRVDDYPGTGTPYTIGDVSIGKWSPSNKVIVVAVCAESGYTSNTITITPNAGGKSVVATPIAGASTFVQFYVAEVCGLAESITLVRSGADIGRSQYGIWWMNRLDLASITPTTSSARATSGTSLSTSLTYPANSVVLGAAMHDGAFTTIVSDLPHASRYYAGGPGETAFFFDRCNDSLDADSVMQMSGSATASAAIQVLAFQATTVAATQTLQAHNAGKWQVNVMFPYAASEFPFANLLKAALNISDWDGSEVKPDHLNAQGYPLPGWAIKYQDVNLLPIPGNYRLKWKGTATFQIAAAHTVVSGSLTGTDGEAVFSTSEPRFGLYHLGDATDPAYDISVVHEDYCASYDGGNIWNPRFLERLMECRPGTIRFLDWINPNSGYAKWEHRKPLDYSVWSDKEYRGSAYVTTTNVGNAFTTSGSGGVLTHGQLAIVLFNAAIVAPYGDATLNWKGTGAKPIKELTGYSFNGWYAPPNAGTYHTGVFDSVLDAWLFEGAYAEPSYPIVNGVPIEAIFDLCNRVGANCWIPIPFLATDPVTDYIPGLAALAREQLHPWLKLFTEPGNEWWNNVPPYVCTFWGHHRAEALWGVHSYDGVTLDHLMGYRFYNQASANLGRTLATVFANDRTRYANVSATQGLAHYTQTVEQAYAEDAERYRSRVLGEEYHTDSGEYAKPWVTHVCCSNYWGAAEQDTPNQATLNTEYLTATAPRKAEILNEYLLGPLDVPENLYRQYSGRAPLDTTGLGYNHASSALKWHADRCYAAWGQIAADNGHGFVAYEGGLWTHTEVGLDARLLGTAARDLVRFDFQNWLDRGGTFPSQYWLASPRWNISLLSPSIYAADSPQYLGVLDFNDAADPTTPALIITTEDGDTITTESGEYLLTEGDTSSGGAKTYLDPVGWNGTTYIDPISWGDEPVTVISASDTAMLIATESPMVAAIILTGDAAQLRSTEIGQRIVGTGGTVVKFATDTAMLLALSETATGGVYVPPAKILWVDSDARVAILMEGDVRVQTAIESDAKMTGVSE